MSSNGVQMLLNYGVKLLYQVGLWCRDTFVSVHFSLSEIHASILFKLLHFGSARLDLCHLPSFQLLIVFSGFDINFDMLCFKISILVASNGHVQMAF